MRTEPVSSGFALLLVLWTLAVLSAIALTLAASVGTEVRASQESWDDLQAERLAKSGQEIAAYLDTRRIGAPGEDLSELPVTSVIPGLSYHVRLDIGSIDLFLEGENGKLDLSSSSEDAVAAFFTGWTGDPVRGREIAASLADWMDPDDESRPQGGESSAYAGRGYLPRNAGLGAADLSLIKGFTSGEFAPAVIDSPEGVTVRNPIPWFAATALTGARVNVNYASPIILQSIPGMTSQVLASILQGRRDTIFSSVENLRSRTGLLPDDPVLSYLTVDRGNAPAVRAVARLQNSTRTRTERRMRNFLYAPGWKTGMPVRSVLWLVERHAPIG